MEKCAPKEQTRADGAGKPLAGRRKAEAVLRVIAGEDAHDVATSLGATAHEVERWRREFLLAGERRMGELPLGWAERCMSPFERLVPLATLVSVGIAVALFVQGQQRDREGRDKDAARAREQRVAESFNALDDKYIEYVKLCLQHPDLDVFDTPLARAAPATPGQKREESMMLAILFSLFERSYLMYRDPSDDFKKEEWRAWEAYVGLWLSRGNFLDEWARTKGEFDSSFNAYLDGRITKGQPVPHGRPASRPATPSASGSVGP